MATHYKGNPAETKALNVFINLFRASDTLRIAVQRHIKDFGLTEPQFGVLEALYHLGPLEQHILAEKLLVSRGNVTFIIDKLEKMNFVSRAVVTSDRRCNKVELTNTGREFIERIFPEHAKFITGLMNALDADEQILLAGLLKKLGCTNQIKLKENNVG